MATASPARSNSFLSRLKTLLSFQKFNHTVAEGGGQTRGQFEHSNWKILDSRKMGIHQKMIPVSPWIVLRILQNKGFEAYLVGGCVRDLLLNRVPKDFDVITTAKLEQIRKSFHNCHIVGSRFPICRVLIRGTIVEVSSFDTVSKDSKEKELILPQIPKGCDHKDLIRWRNCMHRDFTINSLFFDPFVYKIYDYANALIDLRSSKLRTLIPAQLSFEEDCARILRGLRLAARLNFSFSKEIESAICKISSSILSLAKSRIMMELDYMLCYGAAEPSLSLLWRFHLLDILLPVQAAHLTQQACNRFDQINSMLMKLFSNLDQLVGCDRPAHGSVWVAIFAFHLALVKNPQQPLVVLTFASLLYHGNWRKGVEFARQHSEAVHIYVPEISDSGDLISDDELGKRITQFGEQVQNCVHVLTETDSLKNTLAKFPGFPCSDLVFLSKKMGSYARQIFDTLVQDVTSLKTNRKDFEINYNELGKGKLREVRFVLGKIVLDTLGCGVPLDSQQNAELYVEKCRGLNDLRKHFMLVNEDKKCNTLSTDCEEQQEVAKKPKMMVTISDVFEDGQSKNCELVSNKRLNDVAKGQQDLIEDSTYLEVARKHQGIEGIGTLLQEYARKMQEKQKVDSHQLAQGEMRMLENLKYLQRQPELSIKEQKPSVGEEYKKVAKDHLKLLEQVNESNKSDEKCHLQEDIKSEKPEVLVQGNKSKLHQNEEASTKNIDRKRKKPEEKGRRLTLSDLF